MSLADRLDVEDRDWFEKRVVELGLEHARVDAERLALLMVLQRFPAALMRVTVLQLHQKGTTRWMLTTDVRRALRVLADRSVAEIRAADLSEVLQTQFNGVAFIEARSLRKSHHLI